MRLLSGNTLENYEIEDIATGLSNICRWGGQTATWFSVAEHCVMVADAMTDYKINGLMHDAAEFVFQDMPTPVKAQLADYKTAEDYFQGKIYDRFGIKNNTLIKTLVKQADLKVRDWESIHYVTRITTAWTPREARAKFLDCWDQLRRGT